MSPTWKEQKDSVLAESLKSLLTNDVRTTGKHLQIAVDGCVAHVEAKVSSEAERKLLRSLLRQQDGLYAVWDMLTLSGQKLAVADIGCGGKKQFADALGIDRIAAPGVDMVLDLEQTIPLKENSFDNILAVNVLEHIHRFVELMNELHRILRSTGVLHIVVPNREDVIAFADPTHVRLMDMQTFKYFCEPHPSVMPWRPLMVTASKDTIFADLQPLKDRSLYKNSEIARWFY